MIVTIAPQPDEGTTLVGVILGSFGITAIAIAVAAILGAGLAYLLIRWHRRHPPEEDRLPPISPLIVHPSDKSH